MFSIFKKKYPAAEVDLSFLGTDMHSHLLPGIDDGSPDMDTSLELKKGLEDMGFRQFITTPHVMWDMYKNTPDSISGALERVRQAPGQQNITAAAEYFLDEHFDLLLDTNQPLLALSGKKVLVEFSFVSAPMDLKEKLFKLQIKGYQPVLAHPERYTFYAGAKKMYDKLRDLGCLFQVNLLSLTGYYGKISQDLAYYLISKKYIDFLGTDLHHSRHLESLRLGAHMMPVLLQLRDSGLLQNASL